MYIVCLGKYIRTVHSKHTALHVNCVVVYGAFVHGIVYCTQTVYLLPVHTVNDARMMQ